MNLTSLITDDITEVLIKIIEFTQIRQKVIIRNIINMNNPGFVPKKMEMNNFCRLLNGIIDQHIQNKAPCCIKSNQYGLRSCLKAKPVYDKHGIMLFEQDKEEYIQFQVEKLLENSLNQQVAAELLRQKQSMFLDSY